MKGEYIKQQIKIFMSLCIIECILFIGISGAFIKYLFIELFNFCINFACGRLSSIQILQYNCNTKGWPADVTMLLVSYASQ